MRLPVSIETPDQLSFCIRRMETLSSLFRQSGFPIMAMPPREEMATLQALLCEYCRKSYDLEWMREFHKRRHVRRAS